ncbi:unnamed protein product [Calypogeia fissa]
MPQSFRIKYTQFKGSWSQDVDNWMEHYLATATNDEVDNDTRKKLFQGLIGGEALKWYNALDAKTRDDWDRLKTAFKREFREIEVDARIMQKLNDLCWSFRSTGKEFKKEDETVKQQLKEVMASLVEGASSNGAHQEAKKNVVDIWK